VNIQRKQDTYISNVLQFSLDEKPYKIHFNVKEMDFWVALKKAKLVGKLFLL
jgi:hypothetical protein